ncbi:hypothetical protein N7512_001789 [Penicillium capsulatum]|nr:hypothetical protein N7512_001789 [Penicillium capsulatum]
MGKSSKDKRDAYYRLAKEQNWRARSAFKLIQIDEQFDLFDHEHPENVTRVVDLCAAPGSWSQVLSRILIKGESFGRRAWIDKKRRDHGSGSEPDATTGQPDPTAELQPRQNVQIPISPIPPPFLCSCALDPEEAARDQPHPVDLVISDGAPDVTGLHDLDIYIQSQLLYAALNLAMGVLRPGGKFVAKIFRARDVDLLYAQLRTVFERVSVAKPRSSRASSLEAFIVCEGFIPPSRDEGMGGMAALKNPLFGGAATPTAVAEDGNIALEVREDEEELSVRPVRAGRTAPSTTITHPTEIRFLDPDSPSTGPVPAPQRSALFAVEHRWIPSFIACGDLSAWDSDASYALPPNHVSLDPVQPPTAPPYRKAMELRKEKGGAYGKTKLGTVGRA